MNRKASVILWLLLMDVVSKGYAITIVQPENNAVFHTGQKVKVVVLPSHGEKLNGMWIKTTRGGSEILEGPPFETELKLDDQYVGKEKITAISKINKDRDVVESSISITVQLQSDVKLEKIIVGKSDSILKSAVGKPLNTRKLRVQGLFTDNVRREISATYTSSDSNIVSVDSNGVMTALNLGRAIVSINADDKSESVDIKVYINIDIDRELLVKPTETGLQLNWKLSPQDPEWVTGYMVFRTEDPDGVIKRKIADLPNGTNTYIDRTAEKLKVYYYGVQAISASTNERSRMTDMTPMVLP